MASDYVREIYQLRKTDPALNTSYPLCPDDWARYCVDGDADFSKDECLSFYIHIPFCERLCPFCEYSRTLIPSEKTQERYLRAVRGDIESFLSAYPNRKLQGFDIGGGTPTALSYDNFSCLMDIFKQVKDGLLCSDDFEASIEATFQTLDREKAELIRNAGIKRLSLGVQSSQPDVQRANGRDNAEESEMAEKLAMLNETGIEKVNLDFMYGLRQQALRDIENDIRLIERLSPQQVTLYELRANMLKSKYLQSKSLLFESYSLFYDALRGLGYHARFGQNTFSRNPDDKGLSSYLRHRMIDFLPYKGFGISAQSMSKTHISYNEGKLAANIRNLLAADAYRASFTYELPPSEMLAKYVAVSGYYGSFSVATADKILGRSFLELFRSPLAFCREEGLLTVDGDSVTITRSGFMNYGAVFSLFYPNTLRY